MTRLQEIMTAQALQDARVLARTAAADVWRVHSDGDVRVLKVYRRGNAGNEAQAASVMQAWGPPMVRVLWQAQDAVLMDRLDGPSLGDLARDGDDLAACRLLADTARALHASLPVVAGLTPLPDLLKPLLRLGPEVSVDMQRAIALTRALLNSAPTPRPLHGDLHHENVILTPDGPRAFDAKGVLGDPAFELANAFRHPKGVDSLDPQRIDRCLEHYAAALTVPRQRLAHWAAVKCAHSIALRNLEDDPEHVLLNRLLAI